MPYRTVCQAVNLGSVPPPTSGHPVDPALPTAREALPQGLEGSGVQQEPGEEESLNSRRASDPAG